MTRPPAHRLAAALLGVAALAVPTAAPALAQPGDRADRAPDGRVPATVLQAPAAVFNGTYLREHDVALAANGSAYLAWGSSDGTVSVCELRAGSAPCVGGVRSTSALGDPRQLEVGVSGGVVRLVWMYDTDASVSSPTGARLATTTVQPDGSLAPATVAAEAPSFGSMLSATVAPDGRMWAVVQPGAGQTGLVLYPGLTTPTPVATPYWVGDARLAFGSAGEGALAISQYGTITSPIAAARLSGGVVGGFSDVGGTWNASGFGLTASSKGIRLVASRNDASYRTVVSTWDGARFGRTTTVGDKACTAAGHDLSTDDTGRLVDAFGGACGTGVTHVAGTDAATATLASGGTQHAGPQVATTPSGLAWLAWAVEGDGGAFDKLLVAPVGLPPVLGETRKRTPSATLTLSRPVGCLPPAKARLALKVKPARGWRKVRQTLTLDGRRTSRVDGGRLEPGTAHKVVGTAVVARGRTSRTVKVTARIRTCGE
jgi:hypothetical protein